MPINIRWAIVTLKRFDKGTSNIRSVIYSKFNYQTSEGTVQRTWKRFVQTGKVEDCARSGRPRKCSARDERVLRRLAIQQRAVITPTRRIRFFGSNNQFEQRHSPAHHFAL